MAKIVWTDEAKSEFRAYIINARSEFGETTAKRWQKERKEIEWRLERYPTSYTPEKLLQGKRHLYRGCHIMGRRFKIIYYYDEAEKIAHIVDIWDTRKNPQTLIKRIK